MGEKTFRDFFFFFNKYINLAIGCDLDKATGSGWRQVFAPHTPPGLTPAPANSWWIIKNAPWLKGSAAQRSSNHVRKIKEAEMKNYCMRRWERWGRRLGRGAWGLWRERWEQERAVWKFKKALQMEQNVQPLATALFVPILNCLLTRISQLHGSGWTYWFMWTVRSVRRWHNIRVLKDLTAFPKPKWELVQGRADEAEVCHL